MVETTEKPKVVEIENLSFSYPNEHQALKNVTLTIYIEETVAIIGPNGFGKSTLLLHLNVVDGETKSILADIPLLKAHGLAPEN